MVGQRKAPLVCSFGKTGADKFMNKVPRTWKTADGAQWQFLLLSVGQVELCADEDGEKGAFRRQLSHAAR